MITLFFTAVSLAFFAALAVSAVASVASVSTAA